MSMTSEQSIVVTKFGEDLKIAKLTIDSLYTKQIYNTFRASREIDDAQFSHAYLHAVYAICHACMYYYEHKLPADKKSDWKNLLANI